MIIYKITNLINNKIYIGQTIGTVQERWHRHVKDAMSNRLDTHFARAIRKYGENNFKVEIIDDTASSQAELTQKEHDYIIKYNSILNGYNETEAIEKSGGNTYFSKTEEEMEKIKEKIRATKIGGLNPHATKVKCLNTLTKEEYHFNSMAEMAKFLHQDNHTFIFRRCNHTIKALFKGVWAIAYENDNYNANATTTIVYHRSHKLTVTNMLTNQTLEFSSFSEAGKYYNINSRKISNYYNKYGNHFNINDLNFNILN